MSLEVAEVLTLSDNFFNFYQCHIPLEKIPLLVSKCHQIRTWYKLVWCTNASSALCCPTRFKNTKPSSILSGKNVLLANCLRPLAFQHESNIKQKFKLRYSWKKYLIWKVFSFCLVSSNWDLRSFLFFRKRGNIRRGSFFLHSKKMSEFSHYDRKEEVEGVGHLGWGDSLPTEWSVQSTHRDCSIHTSRHSQLHGSKITRHGLLNKWFIISLMSSMVIYIQKSELLY